MTTKVKKTGMTEQRAARKGRDESHLHEPEVVKDIASHGKEIGARWEAGHDCETNSDTNIQQAEDRYKSGGLQLLDAQDWLKDNKVSRPKKGETALGPDQFTSLTDFIVRGCGISLRQAYLMKDIATGKTTLAKHRAKLLLAVQKHRALAKGEKTQEELLGLFEAGTAKKLPMWNEATLHGAQRFLNNVQLSEIQAPLVLEGPTEKVYDAAIEQEKKETSAALHEAEPKKPKRKTKAKAKVEAAVEATPETPEEKAAWEEKKKQAGWNDPGWTGKSDITTGRVKSSVIH